MGNHPVAQGGRHSGATYQSTWRMKKKVLWTFYLDSFHWQAFASKPIEIHRSVLEDRDY